MLRTAFELPFVIATAAFALAVLVAILAGVSRFGLVRPAAPALSPGRSAFLRNVADLIEFGQGGGAVLRRYPRLVLADIAARLRAPSSLDEDGQVAVARPARDTPRHELAHRRSGAAKATACPGRHGQRQARRHPRPSHQSMETGDIA